MVEAVVAGVGVATAVAAGAVEIVVTAETAGR
jgi:hypothetical protein